LTQTLFPITIDEKKKLIKDCLIRYNLSPEQKYHDSIFDLPENFFHISKQFTFIILMYNRECDNDMLKKVSDQPAGLIKQLRKKGFVFQSHPSFKNKFFYRNSHGEVCRKIISYTNSSITNPHIGNIAKDLISKSTNCCLSAIEVYNKPNFKYREETFSILMINAWELLLKAKILVDNNNKIIKLYALDKNKSIKRNRSGNALTIGLDKALELLCSNNIIDYNCKSNIEALCEIRDNSIHFLNINIRIDQIILGIGMASIKNYVRKISDWFNIDMSQYNFFLMPLSFFPPENIDDHALLTTTELNKFINFIYQLQLTNSGDYSNHESHISLDIDVSFKRTSDSSHKLFINNQNEGIPITLNLEDEYKDKYRYSYDDIKSILKRKYPTIKFNKIFHDIVKNLKDKDKNKERLFRRRYLDPTKSEGTYKDMYTTEMIKEIGEYYRNN
jgi:hypothetical protein